MFTLFFPLSLGGVSGGFGADEGQIRQMIVIERGEADLAMQLVVFRGAPSPPQKGEGESMALLDATTGIMGNADSVREAIGRWRKEAPGSDEMSARARQLSASYDNWFLAVKPLEELDRGRSLSVSKSKNDLLSLVEEVRGGVRLGAFNEVSVNVVMKTAEDAAALAGIGRWLPGFIQLQESHSPESALAALVDNLAVTANGRTVSITFSIDEMKLEEMAPKR
jgi:hypothetical protein